MDIDHAAVVWDRACFGEPDRLKSKGDRALASMIRMHSFIMNGGVHHALNVLSESEVIAALSAYDYFGVTSATTTINRVRNDPLLKVWNDVNEQTANTLYYTAIPDDKILIEAFDKRYTSNPDDFDETL